jgi:hypothetical protein
LWKTDTAKVVFPTGIVKNDTTVILKNEIIDPLRGGDEIV